MSVMRSLCTAHHVATAKRRFSKSRVTAGDGTVSRAGRSRSSRRRGFANASAPTDDVGVHRHLRVDERAGRAAFYTGRIINIPGREPVSPFFLIDLGLLAGLEEREPGAVRV